MNDPSTPPSRRWTQFSLKSLLLLMLLAAAFSAGWSISLRKAREAEMQARQEAERAQMAEMVARLHAEEAMAQARLAQAQAHIAQAQAKIQTAQAKPDLATEIETVLRLQAEAWNAGNIDRFMEHYLKADRLTFSAGGKTTRGWEATLARYRERYPTREKMGQLTFDQLEILPLGDSAALVLGRWQLTLEGEMPGGNFSLIVQKLEGRWVIVHDHTSKADAKTQAEE